VFGLGSVLQSFTHHQYGVNITQHNHRRLRFRVKKSVLLLLLLLELKTVGCEQHYRLLMVQARNDHDNSPTRGLRHA